MPSLFEFLNPTFLLFLGISILAIALLVLYFESKFRDQNHKISSMLSLVSSLAEELNGVKMNVNILSMHGGNKSMSMPLQTIHLNNQPESLKNDLITVSDDDSDSNDDSEEYDELEADESDSESEDLEDTSVIEIGETNNVKILKLNIENDNELDELDDIQSVDSGMSVNKNQLIIEKIEDLQADELLDLKTIDISNLEKDNEDISTSDKVDYKKLPIGKLKSIVSEKGLASDPSKLKKPDLLKLLGVE